MGLAVSEKKTYSFFYYKSMQAYDLQGVANLDHMGMVGSINEGDHKILLHTKYLSYGPHGFREEDF